MCRHISEMALSHKLNLPYAGTDGHEKMIDVDERETVLVFRYLPDSEPLIHKNGTVSSRYVTELAELCGTSAVICKHEKQQIRPTNLSHLSIDT